MANTGKIQNDDVKTEADLIAAGATKANLINDDKIYVTGASINDTLKNAIDNGLIGGGGSASLDDIFQLFGDELIGDWSTGNNASFLGGGSIAGAFVYETVSPLNGDQSYKYTQAAGSLNDYIASPIQAVPVRFRGNQGTLVFPYNYDGNDNDFEVVVYDVTNATKLTVPGFSLLKKSVSTTSDIYKVTVQIPLTCTQVRIGFQVKVLNSGKILNFDDVVLTSVSIYVSDVYTNKVTLSAAGSGNFTGGNLLVSRVGSQVTLTTPTAITHASSASATSAIGFLPIWALPSTQTVNLYNNGGGAATYRIVVNPAGSFQFSYQNTATGAGINLTSSTPSVTITYNVDDGLGQRNIITAPESFSTDTAQLTYVPGVTDVTTTLNNLGNLPIGSYSTFTYAESTNTRAFTTTRPTQTDANMNLNGIQIFTRAFNAASTALLPAVIAIQIGKGLKGHNLELFAGSGKVNNASIDNLYIGSLFISGLSFKGYNEATGILLVDAGYDANNSSTTRLFLTSTTLTSQNNGYLVINASKNPSLLGIGIAPVAARGVQSSGQSIPNNVETTVTYNATKTYDTTGSLNAATGIYTVPETGLYSIQGKAGFVNGTTGQRLGYVKVSGNYRGLATGGAASPVNSGGVSVIFNDILFLTKGNLVSLTLFQSSGGSVSLATNDSENYFAIAKVNI